MAERHGYSDFMATEFIDRVHKADYRALFESHVQQQKRSLGYHKNQLHSLGQNQKIAQARYVRRLESIDEKRDRIADRIYKQHNSPLGKLQGMTKAGRAKQREQIERLDDRRDQLKGRVTRHLNALTERQEQAMHHERLAVMRTMRDKRQDHVQARQAMQQTHQQNRPRMIEDRKQAMWQQAEQQLKQALRQQQEQAQQQTQGRRRTG